MFSLEMGTEVYPQSYVVPPPGGHPMASDKIVSGGHPCLSYRGENVQAVVGAVIVEDWDMSALNVEKCLENGSEVALIYHDFGPGTYA